MAISLKPNDNRYHEERSETINLVGEPEKTDDTKPKGREHLIGKNK